MSKTFQVIEDDITYEFEEAEEGGYTVTVPDLSGCISEGDTFEEALEMIKDAMVGWLTVAKKYDDPFPDKYLSFIRNEYNSQ